MSAHQHQVLTRCEWQLVMEMEEVQLILSALQTCDGGCHLKALLNSVEANYTSRQTRYRNAVNAARANGGSSRKQQNPSRSRADVAAADVACSDAMQGTDDGSRRGSRGTDTAAGRAAAIDGVTDTEHTRVITEPGRYWTRNKSRAAAMMSNGRK